MWSIDPFIAATQMSEACFSLEKSLIKIKTHEAA
jgi:hypothetical protein